MAGFSDYLEDKVINVFLRNTAITPPATVYATIHTVDPTDTGLADAGLTRVAITFAAPSGGVASNSGVVSFTGVTAGTYVSVSIWDASTAGNMLYSGALSSSITAAGGDTISFAASALTVTNT